MANRTFDTPRTLGKERIHITGSFRPNGSSAIDNTLNTGAGFTVARTNAGIYTITLTDSYVALVSATATPQLSAVADIKMQWGAIDVVTARTLVLNALAVATATEIASNASNRVHFHLVLRNTTVLP